MKTATQPLLCGVELGGSKCVCLLGSGPDDIAAQATVPTSSDADATLTRIVEILHGWTHSHGSFAALGLASFGPLDLRSGSATFGHITSTVKPGWSGTDLLGRLGGSLAVPIAVNTDVNGAALAEGRWGLARSLRDFAYITVGTGVGVGLVVGGRTVFGCNHTELGHVRIARHREDRWPGICPFHGDCVEGLASGPAIAARAGSPAELVADNSPVWEFVAHALAQLLQTIVLATAPQCILAGGGVLQARPQLLDRARTLMLESLNGYLDLQALSGGIERYIVAPGLGKLAGPLGALAVAADAYREARAGSGSVL